MAQIPRPSNRDGFEIAIICALGIERDAIEALLDEEYETGGFSYGKAPGDLNVYTLGRLDKQHVVLAYLPAMGLVSAAAVAANLRSSFQRIKLGLVVGICGGVPKTSTGVEIVLGDVIVSTSITQIDFGRQYSHKFIRKREAEDTLVRANPELRAFVGKISGRLSRRRLANRISLYCAKICAQDDFSGSAYPGPSNDVLYPSEHRHKHWIQDCSICKDCNEQDDEVCESALTMSCEELGCHCVLPVKRDRIQRAIGVALDGSELTATAIEEAQKPSVHFGRMATSNHVMKSGRHRDLLAANEDTIGFEMESGGTWDYVPTIVIKSVSDYADSHKNKGWQEYAAATAASCAKAILEEWRSVDKPLQVSSQQNHAGQWQCSDDCTTDCLLTETRLVTPNPVHWTIARPVNTLFTGREDILSELECLVREALGDSLRHDPCTIVISGMGGQGKSELCLQLAHRLRRL